MANKKRRSSKKSESKANTNKKELTEKQQKFRKQTAAIVGFAVGVLLFFISILDLGSGWSAVRDCLFGMFGWCGFLVAPIIIYISVVAAFDRPGPSVALRTVGGVFLVFLLCALTQSFSPVDITQTNFADTFKVLFTSGVELKSGGVAAVLIGWPLIKLCTKVGATIILIILVFALILIITGTTLSDFLRKASKPVQKLQTEYKEFAEKRKKAKFNVDVPLGDEKKDELPQHPVTSNKTKLTEAAATLTQVADGKAPVDDIEEDGEIIPSPEDVNKPILQIDDIVQKVVAKRNPTPPAVKPNPLIAAAKELPEDKLATLTEFDESAEAEKQMTREEVEEETGAFVQEVIENIEEKAVYHFPPISLLTEADNANNENIEQELRSNAQKLVETLQSFGVQTRITDICRGPAVTRYELQPSAGVKISKITGLSDDIALNLATSGVRIEAPIPNKAAVGIEVPNKNVSVVRIRDIIDSNEFVDAKSDLSFAIGKNIDGKIAVGDISKMPHMLIAGATGSGKSVCINSLIVSLLYKSSPDDVRLLMIDPKVVELGVYNGIPHLLVPVVTDPRKAAGALNWAVTEMLNRYKLFADTGVRDLKGYNRLAETKDDIKALPHIVIIIDELADLMMAAPNEVEDAICRLAQMARAAGMHLVIATQRPSVDVITGVIKANIPSRIAFAVSSQVDSRTIIDQGGAEKLLGRGDMLYYPMGTSKPIRIQGCFVTDTEVESVVEFIKSGKVAEYDEHISEEINRLAAQEKAKSATRDSDGGDSSDEDEMLPQAIEVVVEAGQASTSLLQRKLKLGYARAARIIDQLENRGIVGPFEGAKPRQVLVTRQQWIEMTMRNAPDNVGDFEE